MNESPIFNDLNAAQLEAVAASPGPLLILAGAGSGKTRVLTRRIAWLIDAQRVQPRAILAVTFTNKAAAEMRGRVEGLLNAPPGGMWLGTFHGLCHRLLRLHYAEANLPQAFEIIDSDDQFRLIRRVLRELELDENRWAPREMQWFINGHKENARRPQDLPDGDHIAHTLRRVYHAYETFCRRLGLVDFAELLLRTLELFRNNQTVRETWQQRFQHVLVDEFQDTNAIQYQWLRILCDAHKNLFAVGDDDQSIYGWRGARVENLLSFERHFPAAKVIRLEQNYRSTAVILRAANAVIAHNSGRLGKELWTDLAGGEKIRLYAAHNDIDEARFVVASIEEWVARGNRRDSAAVLYRSNAQSRAFEEQLLTAGMPYRVYGGLRFFERAEIKDALAYLRLIANRDSDPAFERVVNLPTRGIGARTVEAVRARAKQRQVSLWRAAADMLGGGALPARAAAALQGFLRLIDGMADATAGLELGEVADHALTHSGLLEHFQRERGERAQGRVENLQELVNAAGNFEAGVVVDAGDGDGAGDADGDGAGDADGDAAPDALSQFLANAALEAGDTQAEEWEDCVQLMSLHAAKGLEFPLVFLCGMEEGLFPHQRSIDEAGRLEEERRLCYVGMTRAMRRLTIIYAQARRLYGREQYPRPSRFVGEIPPQYLEEIGGARLGGVGFGDGRGVGVRGGVHGDGRGVGGVHGGATVQRPAAHQPADGFGGLVPGRSVRHKKFGEGLVIALEGQGEHARVQVNFAAAGVKWLVCQYARLETL
ncbi:MAG: DNA helicase II [Gammaproteobacteria bacterium]|nr:DNA helicase II [Gammaproteobacteria bacterium]